jgi:hypothetical protein
MQTRPTISLIDCTKDENGKFDITTLKENLLKEINK